MPRRFALAALALRMVAGLVAWGLPVLTFMAAFEGALAWAEWLRITIACVIIGSLLSHYRPPLTPQEC